MREWFRSNIAVASAAGWVIAGVVTLVVGGRGSADPAYLVMSALLGTTFGVSMFFAGRRAGRPDG